MAIARHLVEAGVRAYCLIELEGTLERHPDLFPEAAMPGNRRSKPAEPLHRQRGLAVAPAPGARWHTSPTMPWNRNCPSICGEPAPTCSAPPRGVG